jgi:hypothetical protein
VFTNLLIISVAIIAIAADVAVVFLIRREVRRWCVDAFTSGHRAGQAAADPFKEAYRLGYDLGYERGHRERSEPEESRGWMQFDNGAVIDLPDSQPRGTAWERHDDPEEN